MLTNKKENLNINIQEDLSLERSSFSMSEKLLRLDEVSRQQLLSKSKNADNYVDTSKGKNRYERRKYSRISKSVKNYDSMNMNELFKRDILTVNVPVQGETDNYIIKVKFGGILQSLQDEIKRNDNKLEFKCIHYALVKAFNHGDVMIKCQCLDGKYRFNYISNKQNYNSDKASGGLEGTKAPDITNPHDSKGAGCKHTLLLLSNVDGLMKVASVINNYINLMEKTQERLYAKLMFPKLYGMEYEKAIQTNLFDKGRDYLGTSKKLLRQANVLGRDRGKFKKGNQSGIQFAKNETPEEADQQVELELD